MAKDKWITNEEKFDEKYKEYMRYPDEFMKKFLSENIITGLADWRIPSPPRKPETQEKKFDSDRERRKYVLEPLEEVVLNPDLLDEIIVRCAVPDLLEGREPSYSGVILFGPPGTGKTVLQKALVEVYQRAGAYSSDKSLAQMNTPFVGQFAKNLEDLLEKALNEARKRKKPSFISFDEGSSLVQISDEGAMNVAKHYQEAIDTLKRFIGNYREIVLAVSTNLLPGSFEDALTREGRLTSFLIDYPQTEERIRLWHYFLKKNGIFDNLTPEQLHNLAEATPKEQGAFIEEFCRNYKCNVRNKLLREKGYTTLLEALEQGTDIKDKDIKMAIEYSSLLADVHYAIKRKQERNGTSKEDKQTIGFKR